MKKWYCSNIVKLLMVIVCFMGALVCADATVDVKEINDAFRNEETTTYYDLDYNGYVAFQVFIDYHVEYQSEEYVKSGALIKKEDLDDARKRFKQKASNDYFQAKETYLKSIEGVEDEEMLAQLEEEYAKAVNKIDNQIEVQVDNYRDSIIREQLVEWETTKTQYEQLNKQYDYFIYLSDGRTITNIEIDPTDSVAVVRHFTTLAMYDTYNLAYISPFIFGYDVEGIPNTVSEVYIGVNQDFYDEYFAKVLEENSKYDALVEPEDNIITRYAIGGFLFVFGVLYLMIVAGRKPQDDEIHLTVLDGLYMDIYTLFVIVVAGFMAYFIALLTLEARNFVYINSYIYVLAIGLGALLMMYLTTFSKRIKTRTLLKHTLVYVICHSFIVYIKGIVNHYTFGEKNMTKQVNRILLLLTVIIYGILFVIDLLYVYNNLLVIQVTQGIACVLVYLLMRVVVNHYIDDLMQIKKGTKEIRDGNLSYTIAPLNNQSLNEIADNINCLSEGLKNSVSEAVASEKTKVELVTNISHDLKTPLTSIINYIDLLSKKQELDEEASHYIEVVTLKSNQLKKLVEDLFEITKAQNGQIELDISEICIDDLINQILAEYEEDFGKKSLEVRISSLDKKSIVYADGNKMYRVLSNILGNITKYALDHTRVYVQFEEENADILGITFKNVANYEMNFDSSQMGERFMRGDTARSSDGNGLGLAIAKSFLELQNDTLSIMNDGDLFKVKITLHKKQEVQGTITN